LTREYRYLEHHLDPLDTLLEGPQLGLADGINDGLVVDGSVEPVNMDGLGDALIQSQLAESLRPLIDFTYEDVPSARLDRPVVVVSRGEALAVGVLRSILSLAQVFEGVDQLLDDLTSLFVGLRDSVVGLGYPLSVIHRRHRLFRVAEVQAQVFIHHRIVLVDRMLLAC
jgi:hypothetical protein